MTRDQFYAFANSENAVNELNELRYARQVCAGVALAFVALSVVFTLPIGLIVSAIALIFIGVLSLYWIPLAETRRIEAMAEVSRAFGATDAEILH